MTDNETELIDIVRENKHPARAMLVAIYIILSYLKQHGSSPRPSSVDLQERV